MCSKLETTNTTFTVDDRIKYIRPWFAGTIHGQAGVFNADEDHNWLVGDVGHITNICGALIDAERDDGTIDTFMAEEIALLPSAASLLEPSRPEMLPEVLSLRPIETASAFDTLPALEAEA